MEQAKLSWVKNKNIFEMEYKEYKGEATFEDYRGKWYGEVLYLNDVITFCGRPDEELRLSFSEAINAYLEFCRVRCRSPERSYI